MRKLEIGKDLLAQVIEIYRISAALDQVDEELNKGKITSREADRRRRELQKQSKELEAAIIQNSEARQSKATTIGQAAFETSIKRGRKERSR
jgi:hypothetical protein